MLSTFSRVKSFQARRGLGRRLLLQREKKQSHHSLTTTGAAAPNGENGLLVDGVSIASYNATTDPSVADYVTSFTEISAGTTTTTTAAVTAVTLNRTGW